MEPRDLLPKDKFDIETAEKLSNFSYEEIKPIIPELMEWIQDMNWPVSHPVADYLISVSENLTDEILKVLEGDDEMWKYWCIGVFGFYSKKELDPRVEMQIRRIAANPTENEIVHEVDQQAKRAIRERKISL